jgi:quercetin 2,3-dioxygenase
MMIIRRATERGAANHGWLDSRHTFSFADYHDPAHMGFRALRVINEDRVKPGMGFGTHGHRDMEIISVVLEGELAHRDSMGTGSVLRPGDVQRMSAGSGVRHSEFNGSKEHDVHFLQIWLLPDRDGVAPSYAEKTFSREQKQGKLALIASPDGAAGSLSLNADVRLYGTLLDKGEQVTLPLPAGRHAWVHVAKGDVEVNGERLCAGDGVALSDVAQVELRGHGGEALLFDLA